MNSDSVKTLIQMKSLKKKGYIYRCQEITLGQIKASLSSSHMGWCRFGGCS